MRIALIPPKGLERYALSSTLHMALAITPVYDSAAYMDTYTKAKERGHYIIMDNGANERMPISGPEITRFAAKFRANEIVLPDVVSSCKQTIEAVDRYLSFHPEIHSMYNCMLVLQGKTMSELLDLAKRYSETEAVQVLGIPRVVIDELECKSARIDLANAIERSMPRRFTIHLLGAAPSWPKEVKYAATYAPHIRSMDTSLPFNYYLAGYELNSPTSDRPVQRPAHYFTRWHNDGDTRLLSHNIQVLMDWANGK